MFAEICLCKDLDWVGPLLLCRQEVDRVPAGISGVYLLQAFAASVGGYPVFYVGKSQDLHRRLSEHVNWRMTKPLITAMRAVEQCYFSAAPVTATDLAGVEAALIRLLRPPCNQQTPLSSPQISNLPPLRLNNRHKPSPQL
jgi:excinuclease UvrABC nuclease subunit